MFKVLLDTDGAVKKYKARLCARGFLQTFGVDYTETFAPLVGYDSLRVVLALVTNQDLEMMQFDIKTAFLYGELEETIYMQIPEGLKVKDGGNVLCKLNKSLYGLKQAPRCWNKKFNDFLKRFEFRASDADNCIYTGTINNCNVYLALFVDDGLIASKSLNSIHLVLNCLKQSFEVTLGDTSTFVGSQIERNRAEKTMFLHQSSYTKLILDKFKMTDAKSNSIPTDPHTILSHTESQDNVIANIPYREAVGSLMFLALVSRPDISYAVNLVSRYCNKPNHGPWSAVKRIFKYLVGTINHGILYESGGRKLEISLSGYSDADFAGDVDTRRSTTGYAFCINNFLVTWSSQRQKMVTLSTTESEYVAAATASKEIVWLRQLLTDLGHCPRQPTVLFIDNQSTIRLIRNPEFHKRTKHIDVKFHFIREKVENNLIDIKYLSTNEQLSDLFTKSLTKNRFNYLCAKLNIVNAKHVNGGNVK